MSKNWFLIQRENAKLSQAAQAKACGVTTTAIAQYEKGIATPRMSSARFNQIASGYGITPGKLKIVVLERLEDLRSDRTRNKHGATKSATTT